MRPRVLIILSLFGFLPFRSSSQSNALWRLHTDHRIAFYQTTPEGILVVSTEGDLLGVDTATGNVIWTRHDVPNDADPGRYQPYTSEGLPAGPPPPRAWLDILSEPPFGILTIDSAGVRARLELIDLRTGGRRWDSRAMPIGDVRGFFEVPGKNVLLVYGVGGTPGVPEEEWLGVDLATGAVRWQSDSLLPEPPVEFEADGTGLETSRGALRGHQAPLVDSDSTAVLFLSEAGPVKIDLRRGKRVWAAEARMGRPPAFAQSYPRMLLADGILYAPAGKSLQAFNVADGRPRWPAPVKFSGQVAQLELTAGGLLVRGSRNWAPPGNPATGKPFLALLDPLTGNSRWPSQGKSPEVTTPVAGPKSSLYAATRDRLYRIALRDGAAQELAKLKFKGGEAPSWLEYRDSTVLVGSEHTLALFDTTGAVLFQEYFERPPASTAAQLLHLAMIAGAIYSLAARPGYGYYVAPAIRPVAAGLRPPTSSFAYVVVARADSAAIAGPGILKVEKETGRVAQRLVLGTRTPDFQLDERGQLLFVKASDSELACYRF